MNRTSNTLQLAVVSIASFVVWSGFGAILPYLPLFLQDEAHASVSLIGVIAASYYVGTFLFASPMGALSDRIGRKPLLLVGVGLYSAATLLFVTTTNPYWFILFRFLEGAGAGTITPAGQSFVADITTDAERGRAYGWFTSAQFGGLVAGPALGIALYTLAGGEGLRAFYAIFLFGAVAAFLTGVALALLIREPEGTRRLRREPVVRPRYRSLLTRPVVAFLIVAAATHLAMGSWEVVWSIWLRELGAPMAFVGLTWMAFSVPMLLSFLTGRLADRYDRFLLMFGGLAFAALAWIVYGVTRNLQVFLLFSVLEGVAMAIAWPAKQSLLVAVSPPRWIGSIQGLENSTMQAAGFAGTLVAPLLYERISGVTIAVFGVSALAGLAVAAPLLRSEAGRLGASRPAAPPPLAELQPPLATLAAHAPAIAEAPAGDASATTSVPGGLGETAPEPGTQ